MSRTLAGMNVLVVDDNKFIVGLLQRYLEKLGVTAPLHAHDGMSALDQVDSAPVDLVLCDLSMPGMDGIEFLRHLAEREMPPARSEEHTSELQSLMRISYAVFCLTKKKNDST